MTLTDMVTEIRERLAETDEADYWSDSFITSSINEARRRLCAEERWDWMFTVQDNIAVADGAKTIELIDDVVINRHFSLMLTRDSDGQLFLPDRVSPSQAVRMMYDYQGISDTNPSIFYLAANVVNEYVDGETAVAHQINIWPEADTAYTAQYHFYRRPTALSDASPEDADIPEDYQDGVVARATGMLWLKELDQHTKAQEQFELYAEVLTQARDDKLSTSADDPIRWGRSTRRQRGRTLRDQLPRHLG